jgi:hypothetical protein
MPAESPAAFSLSCKSLSEASLRSLSIENGECGISSAARNAPFAARQSKQRQPKLMGAGVCCSLQSRIAPIDRIGILQCTKPYVHDAKPPDYRVFEIIAVAHWYCCILCLYMGRSSFDAYLGEV